MRSRPSEDRALSTATLRTMLPFSPEVTLGQTKCLLPTRWKVLQQLLHRLVNVSLVLLWIFAGADRLCCVARPNELLRSGVKQIKNEGSHVNA